MSETRGHCRIEQRWTNCVEVRAGLLDRQTCFQASDDAHPLSRTRLDRRGRVMADHKWYCRKGDGQIGFGDEAEAHEAAWGHADDRERHAFHTNGPADDGGVTVKPSVPERVADHAEGFGAG